MFIKLQSIEELVSELLNNNFDFWDSLTFNWKRYINKKNRILIIICDEKEEPTDGIMERRYSVGFNLNLDGDWRVETFFSIEKSIVEILIDKEAKLLMFPLSRICFYYGD